MQKDYPRIASPSNRGGHIDGIRPVATCNLYSGVLNLSTLRDLTSEAPIRDIIIKQSMSAFKLSPPSHLRSPGAEDNIEIQQAGI
jgi:hypothetical protein